MRLAASDTSATGCTTLLMKIRLDTKIRKITAAMTAAITSTVSHSCWSSSRVEVTNRITATTVPL